MSYKCNAHIIIHQWDKESDGKQVRVKLPKRMKIEVYAEENDSVESIHEEAMNRASEITGWCILSCSIKRIDFQ